MEWVNPHTWMHVDVKKADGKVEHSAIEAGTPNVLFRSVWSHGFPLTGFACGSPLT